MRQVPVSSSAIVVQPSRTSIGRAVAWMVGALLSFSATAVAIRALSPAFTIFEILSLRNAAALVMLVAYAAIRRESLRPHRFALHGLRNVVHFGATYAWALGVTLLPLATVFALEFTTPAWVALLAAPLLRERLDTGRLIAVGFGFLGVLIILRPGFEAIRPAALIVLAAAFGFAVTTITTKLLTRTVSTLAIMFWMNAIQLPLNLIGTRPRFWDMIEVGQALPIAGVCLGGLLSHVCLTNAYRHGDAVMVLPIDFLRVPLIALVGWLLYAERLDPFVFLGAAVIVAGIVFNLRSESRHAKR
ncbi:MAG TPA: DMT family transporter [Beijerinckiaceae bacterium]